MYIHGRVVLFFSEKNLNSYLRIKYDWATSDASGHKIQSHSRPSVELLLVGASSLSGHTWTHYRLFIYIFCFFGVSFNSFHPLKCCVVGLFFISLMLPIVVTGCVCMDWGQVSLTGLFINPTGVAENKISQPLWLDLFGNLTISS